ncbi:MAG: M23 family metallopeptidase [Candidatus Gracilibacteria bacterium]|nr:M23 family metallopeptidase [Candidatus Gracilibacteria bacterium]
MSKNLHFLILGGLFFFPFTLHSTDIYVSSLGEVQIHANLNPHIIPGDLKLGNTVLIVSAPRDQKDIHIVTKCEHRESILYKEPKGEEKMVYIMQVTFPSSCETTDISIGNQENIFTDTTFPLPIESLSQIESNLINTNSTELLSVMRGQGIQTSTGATLAEKLQHLQILYKNIDRALESDMAQAILQDRENTTYLSPVAGYGIPYKDNIIPGAGRPYRRDTTDGIHHGWDILAPIGTPVQALAKGKIVRIINNWTWADFNNIKRGNLTKDDELTNLDIFRGNQVWLETMDGNVTFYSHLSKISPNIAVGSVVDAGTYLGNIGTTGVPDKHYKNTHLHFEIQQNPFREDMKNPTYLEIMRWDYIGEHMKRSDIYAKMRKIFG